MYILYFQVDIIKSYCDMKKEIDRLLTEEIPKLTRFDLVTSMEVTGQFYNIS